jgi:hypothetical protein
MGIRITIGLGAAVLALAVSAQAKPRPEPKPASPPERAVSAESRGVPASFRADAGHGYSPRERRMLDCLASDPRYDPATDRIHVRPGVSRPCEVKTAG